MNDWGESVAGDALRGTLWRSGGAMLSAHDLQSLHALLRQAVQNNPLQAMRWYADEKRLSYSELFKQSSQLATGFAKRGIKAGDRVAMLLGNRNEFVVTLFALAHLGAIAVPISIREQAPGLAYMLSHCAAVMVVHEADLAHLLPSVVDAPALKYRSGDVVL
jgi:acyl-CoA synthetase (AMP-forming)/AMP-acid ligase II